MADFVDGPIRVLHGDCGERLRELPDSSVDALCTDPPYGLSREPDIAEVLRHWLAGDDYRHSGGGFMGKSWDSFVPGPLVWREAYRVMRPGAHLLAFAGTRTMDLMSISIRMAGFENRDTISAEGVLRWVYGSGFPKSLNVSKAIDRAVGAEREVVGHNPNYRDPAANADHHERWNAAVMSSEVTAPASDAARQWEGWGTALKPAWEPILVFRKPLSETNVAANVLEHGTGAINIDTCRVPAPDGVPLFHHKAQPAENCYGDGLHGSKATGVIDRTTGRWPSNLVLSHSPACVPTGTRRVPSAPADRKLRTNAIPSVSLTGGVDASLNARMSPGHGADGMETVETWTCVQGCPVAELDRQSGTLTSGVMRAGTRRSTGGGYMGNFPGMATLTDTYADQGSASRFFPTFRYQAKASTADRNVGLHNGSRSTHPTVKSTELMRWLVRLITPPGGTVLDPFCGSGSTLVAARLEGFGGIGIEREAEYVETARKRVAWAQHQPDLFEGATDL